MTYSCDQCGVAPKALTGFDVKPPTSNNCWRWSCRRCGKNWARETEKAVVIHLRCKIFSFSFFTRWPLDQWVKVSWPEVHNKAIDLVMTRTRYYCKYHPFPELRDAPPSDAPKYRLSRALSQTYHNQHRILTTICNQGAPI